MKIIQGNSQKLDEIGFLYSPNCSIMLGNFIVYRDETTKFLEEKEGVTRDFWGEFSVTSGDTKEVGRM